jgi:two-component system, NtrC family, sensor kinase
MSPPVTSKRSEIAASSMRSFASSPGRSLTRKFALAIIGVVVVVFGIGAVIGYQRESAQFERAQRAEAFVLGSALARGMADVWEKNGEDAAYRFLGESSDSRAHITVRWVWVDEPIGGGHVPSVDITELRDRILIKRVSADAALYTFVPVTVPGSRRGALELRQSLAEQNDYIRESLRNNIIEAIMLAVLSAGLVFLLGVAFVGRPVARLVDKARRVGAGDLAGPLVLSQRDELGELALEMNRMCDRLSAEEQSRVTMESQLRHAERLTTVGKLASGLAHELGTPLNVVAGRARLVASGDVEGEDVKASARVVLDQTERMTKLIRQLLDFARPRPPQKTEQALLPIAERVVTLLAPMAKTAGISIRVLPSASISHSVDESQLHQVMTNLVVNALHASQHGGVIEISLEQVDAIAPVDLGGVTRHCAALTVRDNGRGMDEATRARVFEPFFSTKQVGEGTGLGLSVSWGIVREHGGWITVDTSVDHGSAFTVYLPIGDASSDGVPVDRPTFRPSGRALSSPPYAPLATEL